MAKKYSVAEARKKLPTLLNEVEDGQQVEITRRGTPVAVVISLADYNRMAELSPGFSEAYTQWRNSVGDDALDLPDGYFDELRDRSLGREVEL